MSAEIKREDGRQAVIGDMTIDSATHLVSEGIAALSKGEALFDLADVTEVDSSGLAVIFGWQRAADAAGKTLRIANPPQSLISLAAVYGVSDMLPSA